MQKDGNAHVARAGSPAARDCPCACGGTGKRAQQLLPVQSKGELQPLFHNSKVRSQVGVLQGEEGRGSPAGQRVQLSRSPAAAPGPDPGPGTAPQPLPNVPRPPLPSAGSGQGRPQPASTDCKRLQLTTSRTKRDPRSESGLETQNSAVLKRRTMLLSGVIVTSGGFVSLISITSGCDGGSTMESWGETNQRVTSSLQFTALGIVLMAVEHQ